MRIFSLWSILELQEIPEIVSQILGMFLLVHFSHEWVPSLWAFQIGLWPLKSKELTLKAMCSGTGDHQYWSYSRKWHSITANVISTLIVMKYQSLTKHWQVDKGLNTILPQQQQERSHFPPTFSIIISLLDMYFFTWIFYLKRNTVYMLV